MPSTNNTNAVPSATWLYDQIMSRIEPDLVSDQLGGLDALYDGETAEDRTARLEQYAAAFIIFQQCLKDVEDKYWADVDAYQAYALRVSGLSSDSSHAS